MKRKIILAIVSILFIMGLIIGIMYISFPELLVSNETVTEENNIVTYHYPVSKGEIVHTYEIEGQVISEMPELYIMSYDLQNISDKTFHLYKQKNESFQKGDAIYSYNGKDKIADFNGKIVDLVYSDSQKKKNISIEILNYDKLYIEAQIAQDKYEKITYETPVKIVWNKKEYDASVTKIGYEINENLVPIRISAPIGILPGTTVKISFVLDTESMGLYVPNSAIYNNGKKYYAFIEEEEGRKQVEITVGQEFSIEEDGNEFHYVEILSGVKENDILVVEEIVNYMNEFEEEFEYD